MYFVYEFYKSGRQFVYFFHVLTTELIIMKFSLSKLSEGYRKGQTQYLFPEKK